MFCSCCFSGGATRVSVSVSWPLSTARPILTAFEEAARRQDAGADVARRTWRRPFVGPPAAPTVAPTVAPTRPGFDQKSRRACPSGARGEGLLRASSRRAAHDRGRRVRVLLPPMPVVTTRTGAVVVS